MNSHNINNERQKGKSRDECLGVSGRILGQYAESANLKGAK
jgi:hypothetical protein